MNDQLTHQEQIEVLKKFWRDYGRYVLYTVVVVALVVTGWRLWHRHQLQNKIIAFHLYQRVQLAINKNDTTLADGYIKKLTQRYPRSVYTTLAQLLSARAAVMRHQLTQAQQALTWALQHTSDTRFAQIIQIRLARVLLARHQPQHVLQLLAKPFDNNWQPLVKRLQADSRRQLKQQQQTQEALGHAQAKSGSSQ